MTTRAKYVGGVQQFHDDAQAHETVHRMAGLAYRDDFLGAGSLVIPAAAAAENGVDWVKKLVQTGGTPTVAGLANAAGGIVQCAIDATAEKQEATLYWGDQKGLDVTKGLVFEARAKLSVLPSAAQVQAVFGLAANWIDGPDNVAEYLQFGATGSGAILLRSQDGTTQSSVASGVSVLATDWHVYRIDATEVTDIRYFIDGVQVSVTKALAFAASGANAVLQPYASVYKSAGAGLGTLQVDYIKAWMNRA